MIEVAPLSLCTQTVINESFYYVHGQAKLLAKQVQKSTIWCFGFAHLEDVKASRITIAEIGITTICNLWSGTIEIKDQGFANIKCAEKAFISLQDYGRLHVDNLLEAKITYTDNATLSIRII